MDYRHIDKMKGEYKLWMAIIRVYFFSWWFVDDATSPDRNLNRFVLHSRETMLSISGPVRNPKTKKERWALIPKCQSGTFYRLSEVNPLFLPSARPVWLRGIMSQKGNHLRAETRYLYNQMTEKLKKSVRNCTRLTSWLYIEFDLSWRFSKKHACPKNIFEIDERTRRKKGFWSTVTKWT